MKFKTLFLLLAAVTPLIAEAQTLHVKADAKGRYGYFNDDGKEVIKCQFDEAGPFINGVAKVAEDGRFGLIDVKGKYVGKGPYSAMEEYLADGTAYYLIAMGGAPAKPGTKSDAGVPPHFRGSAASPIVGARWGVIDTKGQTVIEPEYDLISSPVNGVIYVMQKGKTGFYGTDLKPIVKPTFSYMGSFGDNNSTWVNMGGKFKGGRINGGKYGLIDKQGKALLQVNYEGLDAFGPSNDPLFSSGVSSRPNLKPFDTFPEGSDGYLWFAQKGAVKPGIINTNGTILVPQGRYDVVYKPTDGMAKIGSFVDKKGKSIRYGFYNTETGKETYTEGAYDFYPFTDGVSKAVKKDKSILYFVDKNFTEVSARYDKAWDFTDGYAVVGRNKKYGVINNRGEETVPLVYSNMNVNITEGKVGAKNDDGKWGLIDVNNRTIIPFEYDNIGKAKDSHVPANKSKLWGVVNMSNEVVLPIKFLDFITPEKYPSDYFWVQLADSLWYFYDMSKAVVTFPSSGDGYKYTSKFETNDYAIVGSYYSDTVKQKWGAVRKNGTYVVPIDAGIYSRKDVKQALEYLKKTGQNELSGVALKRYIIRLNDKCNKHSITAKVPEDEWDY